MRYRRCRWPACATRSWNWSPTTRRVAGWSCSRALDSPSSAERVVDHLDPAGRVVRHVRGHRLALFGPQRGGHGFGRLEVGVENGEVPGLPAERGHVERVLRLQETGQLRRERQMGTDVVVTKVGFVGGR